jgi:hypothetical protein
VCTHSNTASTLRRLRALLRHDEEGKHITTPNTTSSTAELLQKLEGKLFVGTFTCSLLSYATTQNTPDENKNQGIECVSVDTKKKKTKTQGNMLRVENVR